MIWSLLHELIVIHNAIWQQNMIHNIKLTFHYNTIDSESCSEQQKSMVKPFFIYVYDFLCITIIIIVNIKMIILLFNQCLFIINQTTCDLVISIVCLMIYFDELLSNIFFLWWHETVKSITWRRRHKIFGGTSKYTCKKVSI